MKKVVYNDGSYLICKDNEAWEYQCDDRYESTAEPTVEEWEDWCKLPIDEDKVRTK